MYNYSILASSRTNIEYNNQIIFPATIVNRKHALENVVRNAWEEVEAAYEWLKVARAASASRRNASM